MHNNPAIQKLLEDRYYLRDEEGNLLETDPSQMYGRVATEVAKAELNYTDNEYRYMGWRNKFFTLMNEGKFLPNTPLLANAGKKGQAYSACYCMYVPDSMDGIFSTLKDVAQVFKTGGGMGLDFSQIREEGALVKSTGLRASGPISFMQVFNTMCESVKQGGYRRGAMMATLRVNHPDIEKFISCKDDGVSLTNFNISVLITDDFMYAVNEECSWPLLSPVTNDVVKVIDARDLWNKICKHAWKTGEPGVVFIDEINRKHPFDKDSYIIKGVNACSEQPLLNGESCVLGAINLAAYVVEKSFRYQDFKKDIHTAVRFLDNVIDITPFPTPEIEKATKNTRKIGLGVMGWADTLIKLKIPYNSQEAIDLIDSIMKVFQDESTKESEQLAIERGVFPAFNDSIIEKERRNAVITTIAPTGSTSRICGCSSGIEPIFAWETHHKLVGIEYDEIHWAYAEYMPDSTNEGLMQPEYMKTSSEISPDWHLRHQEEFQKFIGSSISKTINLPTTATVEDVSNIYLTAWENLCKGITVYRDGSRADQPLNDMNKDIEFVNNADQEAYLIPALKEAANRTEDLIYEPKYRSRGKVVIGGTHKIDTQTGKIYITINYDRNQQEPVETFIHLGTNATPTELQLTEWGARLLSMCLKHNVPIEDIQRQGRKIFGGETFIYDERIFSSLPQLISHLIGIDFDSFLDRNGLDDALANRVEFEPEFELSVTNTEEQYYEPVDIKSKGEYCYNCGGYTMINQGGCMCCTNCGFEKCS